LQAITLSFRIVYNNHVFAEDTLNPCKKDGEKAFELPQYEIEVPHYSYAEKLASVYDSLKTRKPISSEEMQSLVTCTVGVQVGDWSWESCQRYAYIAT